MTQLDILAEKFNRLRDLTIFTKDSQAFLDTFTLKVLSLWKNKNLRALLVKGRLTEDMNKDLRQWFIDHSHLRQDDSFTAVYLRNWICLWLQ